MGLESPLRAARGNPYHHPGAFPFGEALMSERDKWPDPVKRVKDEMDFHAVAGGFGFAVFSLQDGRPITHDTYPSRGAARRFAERKTSDALLILEVSPDGMPYGEADACLRYERTLQAAGFRSPDSLETEENSGLLSMPRTKHDKRRMVNQLVSGRPILPDGLPYGNLPSYFRKG
jgi:hypothetical protein